MLVLDEHGGRGAFGHDERGLGVLLASGRVRGRVGLRGVNRVDASTVRELSASRGGFVLVEQAN